LSKFQFEDQNNRIVSTVSRLPAYSSAVGSGSDNQLAGVHVDDSPFILIPTPKTIVVKLYQIAVHDIFLCLIESDSMYEKQNCYRE
jgi:hypothetical protein